MACLTVVHIAEDLHPASGGPSRTIVHLVDALIKYTDINVRLLAQTLRGEQTVASEYSTSIHQILQTPSLSVMKLGWSVRNELTAWPTSTRPDLIHTHGVWMAVNHWSAAAARSWNVPLIIHTRGMLEPWAINHKSWKKRFALALYQSRDLGTASVLVATAEQEYENLRTLGLRQPIAIIPNGVPMPLTDTVPPRLLRSADSPRTVLFLSRVQGKKGLLNLIDAWALLRPVNWRLLIAGPNEDDHLAEVLGRARRAGVSEAVEYVGEVDGAAKAALYCGADLFVLPTFSENFGVVVAEALAHGLPVITTQGAPWADLPAYGCGWWIPIGVEPLVETLREAMALSDTERAAMGARGLAYVRRYDWASIAEDMGAVYRWVLGQGDKPTCVRLG